MNRTFWPEEVQSYVEFAQRPILDNTMTMDDHCLRLVNSCLEESTRKHQVYCEQYKMLTDNLIGYTNSLEYSIKTFVEQQLLSKRMKIDRHIASIQRDYIHVILERSFN